ncbi:MAG: hypothetical protein JWM55_598 [Acidimicrobiaceae bacterium]|nr:hypothetical protein [Acidimicrobiaceae bacterium]
MAIDSAVEKFTSKWLMEQVFPPIQYVVEGIIPEGLTILVAAPKIGKSWMVLGLAKSLSSGTPVFGKLATARIRPVLYFALEDGPRRLQDRLLQLGEDVGSVGLEFVTELNGDVNEIIRNFVAAHRTHDPIVILDTLGKILVSDGNAGRYVAEYQFMADLKETVSSEPGASLIVVHHSRKADASDYLDAVSGTQGLAGAADTVMVLTRARGNTTAVLNVTSRDAAEGTYSLSFTAGQWILEGNSLEESARHATSSLKVEGHSERMRQVVAAVNTSPDSLTSADLRELLPWLPSDQLAKYLARAVKTEAIVKVSRGVFRRVTSVTSVSEAGTSDTDDTDDSALFDDRSGGQ